MSFHNVVLPVNISYGSGLTGAIASNHVRTASGRDYVNVLWDKFRWSYDLSYEIQSTTQFETLRNFVLLRNGNENTFRVYDESFHTLTDDEQGTWSTGTFEEFQLSATTFQVYAHFSDTAASYSHKITKPISTEDFIVDVYTGGNWVEKTEATDYTVDYNTGIVTWLTGKAPANGVKVRVSCEFHRHCRFTNPEIPAQWANYDHYDFDPIEIMEEKE